MDSVLLERQSISFASIYLHGIGVLGVLRRRPGYDMEAVLDILGFLQERESVRMQFVFVC